MASQVVDLEQQVEAALEELRPALRMDGGDVELVGFVEERLKQRVPEVRQVVSV